MNIAHSTLIKSHGNAEEKDGYSEKCWYVLLLCRTCHIMTMKT